VPDSLDFAGKEMFSMRPTVGFLLVATGVFAAAGCNSRGSATPGDAPAVAKANAGTDGAVPAAAKSEGPAEAVHRFLEAVRTGNDELASQMFTPVARKKVNDLGMQVAPRGSDTAKFEVGKVEMVGQDGARVASKWTDLDPDRKLATYDVVWVLRHESEGWRVAGMVTTAFKGEPPLLLDFEQPEETKRRLELLEEEIQKRMVKDRPQGQPPATGQINTVPPTKGISSPTGPAQTTARETAPNQATSDDSTRQAERNRGVSDPFQR
jgi:hypothetical protein